MTSEKITDMAPKFGGSVRRRRHGVERSVPIVAQGAFDEKGDMTVVFQANTTEGLKPLQPIEEMIRQSTEGFIDPTVARKALRQQAAIVRHARSRKPK